MSPDDPFAGLEEGRVSAPPAERARHEGQLTDERFSRPRLVFERKLDGIRSSRSLGEARASCYSRNDLSLNARYPELAEALTRAP